MKLIRSETFCIVLSVAITIVSCNSTELSQSPKIDIVDIANKTVTPLKTENVGSANHTEGTSTRTLNLGSANNLTSEIPPKLNFTVVNGNSSQDNQSDASVCCQRQFSTNSFLAFVQEIFTFHFWKAKFYLLFYGEDIGPDCDPAYCPVQDGLDEQELEDFVAEVLKNATGEDGKLDIDKLKTIGMSLGFSPVT
uniref:Uncharacterized protein n=1 Tax=Cacopsylla melanoneura TaxID=428564 RepID=A0A8D8M2F9_9HEMI